MFGKLENKERIICGDCGLEKNENDFYLSRIQGQERMQICKQCFSDEVKNDKDILITFKKYNIPFFYNIWNNVCDCTPSSIGEYMKVINSLPQYRGMVWKDSVLEKPKEENEETTYSDIVKSLKIEVKKLNKTLSIASNNNDMSLYIATIKSLRETLELISKYDWQLHYSEYKVKDDNDNWITQVSVWEQNHDNQIKNHKFWNVLGDISATTNESGTEIGTAFASIEKSLKV